MSKSRDWPDTEPTDKQDGEPDTAIVPYVVELNDRGVETHQSCSGHVHADGTRTDGTLWFDAKSVDTTPLVDCEEISHVRRMHKPEDCWEIIFAGLSKDENSLQTAMHAVFEATGNDGT